MPHVADDATAPERTSRKRALSALAVSFCGKTPSVKDVLLVCRLWCLLVVVPLVGRCPPPPPRGLRDSLQGACNWYSFMNGGHRLAVSLPLQSGEAAVWWGNGRIRGEVVL